MCAFWRNFRLAVQLGQLLRLSWNPQKISRPAIWGIFHRVKSAETVNKRLVSTMDNIDSKNLKIEDLGNDSGFLSDKDLSFSVGDLSFDSKKRFTVSVEGNIGSGKTTLLEYFKNSDIVEAVGEPIEQWTNVQGHNALKLLYEDPKRWSFSFNMYAQLTRVQMHMKEHTKPVKILERSLYSTRHCFVENDYRRNTINGMEYAILTSWFDWLVKSQKAEVDLIVYVRAEPEVCFERIKRRSRKEEALVPFSLLENLHNLHEEWLIKKNDIQTPAPVIILDANRDYIQMKELYEIHRHEILCGCV